LLDDAKVAGSAQRRRSGAVLQHGSVLLEKSPAAPELFGIIDLGGKVIAPADLTGAWRDRLVHACHVCWQSEPLGRVEIERAAQIVGEIYGQPGWTYRR
jgi:hypothetical protein